MEPVDPIHKVLTTTPHIPGTIVPAVLPSPINPTRMGAMTDIVLEIKFLERKVDEREKL